MKRMMILLGLLLMIAVACSPTAETPAPDAGNDIEVMDNTNAESQTADESNNAMSDDAMTEDSEMTDESSDDAMTDADTMSEDDNDMSTPYNGPDWTHLELDNANTGETFTLADFAGKTVFVEPMATWCTNCRGQQRRISEVIDQLSPDEYVMMSLSVETSLTPEELATYSADNGFDWTFAVASEELLAALVEQFGRGISSPPSVPHFTISADGTAGNFETGAKSGEAFLSLVRSVAAES